MALAYILRDDPEQAKRIGVYRVKLTEVEKRKLEELKKWIYKRQMDNRR